MSDELKAEEPVNAEATENETAQSTEDVTTDTQQETEVKPDNSVDVEELKRKAEEAERELNAARMRSNQLEKQLERTKAAAETAGNDELVSQLQSELDALKAEHEQEELDKQVAEFEREITTVFDEVVKNYPAEVQTVAKFMKDRNGVTALTGEIQYGFQAERNIKQTLDELAQGLLADSKPEIRVDATNPSITPIKTDKDLIEAELAKPEKDRDFTKILANRLGKRTKN